MPTNFYTIDELENILVFRVKHSIPPQESYKLAMFDLDDTLIRYTPNHRMKKHRFLYPKIPLLFDELVSKGYYICILSNQRDLSNKKGLISKLEWLYDNLQVPFIFVASLIADKCRKPLVGMFEYIKKYYNNVDLQNSFYCGDAAGRLRPKDHSDCDLKMAANMGVRFFTPEECFLIDFCPQNSMQTVFPNVFDLTAYTGPFEPSKHCKTVFLYGQGMLSGKSFFAKKFFPEYKIVRNDFNKEKTFERRIFINCYDKTFIRKVVSQAKDTSKNESKPKNLNIKSDFSRDAPRKDGLDTQIKIETADSCVDDDLSLSITKNSLSNVQTRVDENSAPSHHQLPINKNLVVYNDGRDSNGNVIVSNDGRDSNGNVIVSNDGRDSNGNVIVSHDGRDLNGDSTVFGDQNENNESLSVCNDKIHVNDNLITSKSGNPHTYDQNENNENLIVTNPGDSPNRDLKQLYKNLSTQTKPLTNCLSINENPESIKKLKTKDDSYSQQCSQNTDNTNNLSVIEGAVKNLGHSILSTISNLTNSTIARNHCSTHQIKEKTTNEFGRKHVQSTEMEEKRQPESEANPVKYTEDATLSEKSLDSISTFRKCSEDATLSGKSLDSISTSRKCSEDATLSEKSLESEVNSKKCSEDATLSEKSLDSISTSRKCFEVGLNLNHCQPDILTESLSIIKPNISKNIEEKHLDSSVGVIFLDYDAKVRKYLKNLSEFSNHKSFQKESHLNFKWVSKLFESLGLSIEKAPFVFDGDGYTEEHQKIARMYL